MTLKQLKEMLTCIEQEYSEASDGHEREWSTEEERDKWLAQLAAATCPSALTALMQQLDQGMSLPLTRMTRKVEGGPPKI